MAKKKSAGSTAAEPKATTKASKPAAEKKSTKSASNAATNGKASTAATGFGNHQIGETAGAVWFYLTEEGETSLATIKKDLSLSADLLLAAIGWLAREGKLEFAVSGKTVKISLKS
jgi:Winged helix-turn-helix domain (DUF2582)